MKKKLMIISEATSGGVRKHILDLLFNLPIEKYELIFLYSLQRADKNMIESISSLKDRGVRLIELKYMERSINIKRDIKSFNEISGYIKKFSPDIVHCHSSKAGAIGRISAKLLKVKKIYYTPHAYIMQNPDISNKKRYLFQGIEKVLSVLCTTKTINVSNGEREFAKKLKLDNPNKFVAIYNGIEEKKISCNLSELKQELGIEENNIVVGVAARIEMQKDPLTFIKIAEEISNKNKDVKFIYIGDGKDKGKLESYIKEKSLEKNIKLTGFRNDIEELIQTLDIYLITSLYEGMPYSLIEAIKYGLPIVATNVVGNNEIVEHEKNGLLFNVGDVKDGVEKLNLCIKNENTRKIMGENSRVIFEHKFTIKNMIENIDNIYSV